MVVYENMLQVALVGFIHPDRNTNQCHQKLCLLADFTLYLYQIKVSMKYQVKHIKKWCHYIFLFPHPIHDNTHTKIAFILLLQK